MCYEVVTTADEERGVHFRSRENAITIAQSQGGEVWQLADDDTGTRMCRIWPEPAPSEAASREESEPASEVAGLVVGLPLTASTEEPKRDEQ